MASINTSNQFYFNEQERWFMEMTNIKIKNVDLEILSTELLDAKTAVVTIKQTHTNDESFDFEYPLLFKYEDGKWMDHG